jgi:hypothetical protein
MEKPMSLTLMIFDSGVYHTIFHHFPLFLQIMTTPGVPVWIRKQFPVNTTVITDT